MIERNERYGKVAYINYKGGVFGEDSNDVRMDEPVRVVLGMGDTCPGIQDALYEMAVGETRILIMKPEKGYGEWDPKGVETYPRVMIPGGADLKVGDVLGRKNPQNGLMMPVRVIKADDDYVTMDFNHPLAGKTLEYEVTLVSLED
ncbi:MAG: FKBP-type peptidyl-prolyl cis-trans isomerase [Eggerthellaceae bacterium]|nr:FKBP-type peptidyl-prolyl cis-trans isomerase [Eggerthellaceae bacterium]